MSNKLDITNDLEIANKILTTNDLFFYNQSFYKYDSNQWIPIDTNRIKKQILDILEDKYKQSRVNNIIDIIKLKCLKEEDEINLTKKFNALNIKNGVYYIETGKLIPHDQNTKELFSTNLFDVEYNQNATCKRWESFLLEVFEPDKDKQDKIQLLQEFLGLTLTRNVSFQKALLLLGSGSNGKSKIIDVMEAILGNGNYSNLELNQLSSPTYRVQLQHKLANFCSEIDHKNKFSSSVFKSIVTGDSLTGDEKFKNPIRFKAHCKLIFATNDLPKTTDTTRGYFRRLLILKFNKSFEGKKIDKDLKQKLLDEKDGIFLWLLNGLSRLNKNGKFTNCESSELEVQQYLESSNSVVSYIAEYCEIDTANNCYERYSDLYNNYKIYCSISNLNPFSKNNFRSEIEKHYPGKILFKRTGTRGQHFQNIRIINENK